MTEETIQELEIETPNTIKEELLDDSEALNSADNATPKAISNDEVSFRECLKFSNGIGTLELYSSSLRADDLANVALQFLAIQRGEEKKKPNYTG